MNASRRKASGAYYTPDSVVRSLVGWAVHAESDRMLDPSCGDGRFLALHRHSVGVEQDPDAVSAAWLRAPGAMIHEGNFFAWAAKTEERFECAAGNPPFIRYQRFSGSVRQRALELCAQRGAIFSALSSAWAPFLVATASLLKPGGRMAFVVPAEVGHAPYAKPLLQYLMRRFDVVHFVAVRKKLFPDLSEDCWLLYASGYGGHADTVRFTALDEFRPSSTPPDVYASISLTEWQRWGLRLRPFLLSSEMRTLYEHVAGGPTTRRLGNVARVGIGYVSGNNEFFHLRPSEAERWQIPRDLLHPAVRNGRSLPRTAVTSATVRQWLEQDDPVLLLKLNAVQELPPSVSNYLDSELGHEARTAYKCRMRSPWFAVPDVRVPHAFLTYMSGETPALVANEAGCVCTNSVHAVSLYGGIALSELSRLWDNPVRQLSCELEGHPLGGGMLKIEPREAASIVLADAPLPPDQQAIIASGINTMRYWRHYAQA